MVTKWSLKTLVSGGVFAVFLSMLVLSIFYSLTQQKEHALNDAISYGKQSLAQLSRQTERFLKVDPQLLNEEVAQLSTNQTLSHIVIITPTGLISHSNHYEWLQQAANTKLSPLANKIVQQAQQTRFAIIEHNGSQLWLAMSYLHPSDKQALRDLKRGVVLLNYNLQPHFQRELERALHDHIPEFVMLCLAALILVYALNSLVSKPLAYIRDNAHNITLGKLGPINESHISREIEELSLALNFMSQQLASQMSQLTSQAEHTQSIIDNMVDGLIIIDELGCIQSINPAAQKIFAYNQQETIGHNVKMLMPPPYHDEHDGYLSNYRNTGIRQIIGRGREVSGRRKNGDTFPMELAVSEFTHQGQLRFLGIVRDITERKQIERMKNEFISTVSHELRTPLTAISGALGLLNGKAICDMPATAKPMLEIAQRNSQRLMLLINDLLDMEKLIAGKMEFELQRHELKTLLQQAIESHRTYTTERHVHLHLQAPDSPCLVYLDQHRLMQILANLLSNAIKYSPDQGTIEITLSQQAEQYKIEIQDHGPGIPSQFHQRIFQKFSQADSSDTRQKGGTGLGLAISKELVEKMGGTIGFNSAEGEGACFFVCFPQEK